MQIITDDIQCAIKPEQIDGSKNFMETIWQNMETEISANWLVRFAQQRDSWMPFTLAELEEFYQKKWPGEKFHFNKLKRDGHISEIADGTLAFTIEFVSACYMVAPA